MNIAYVVLVITGVGLMVIEAWLRWRARQPIDVRTTWVSIGVGVLGYATGAGSQLALTTLAYWGLHNVAPFHLSALNPLVWMGYIALDDFTAYWTHRASHRYRFLWSAHMVHHSAPDITMANAARISPFETIYQPFADLWAPLLGFPIAIYAPVTVASLLLAQLQHTRIIGRLGPLDRWLNTPSNHRVHHAKNSAYIDRNFGSWTMIWDRLFGTYVAEAEEPVFGVTDRLPLHSVIGTALGGVPALVRDARRHLDGMSPIHVALARPGSYPTGRDDAGAQAVA
jgi:sterol desaturase/sphingolipid hydroxylase (fatty acid hydroxylase superfamily)